MKLALMHPYSISDLAITLLINKTRDPFTPFITSDSPVIFHNLLKGGLIAQQSKGLIIVVPLSEEVTLCLFDHRDTN